MALASKRPSDYLVRSAWASERRLVTSEISEGAAPEEHFKPVGTWFILGVFVLTIILLWGSVYLILISRGVTT